MSICYARCLGDCRGRMSREHYISRGLLELVSDDDGLVSLGGPLSRVERTSAKNTAVAKILCEYHNSSLSHLDEEVLKLVQSVMEFNRKKESKSVVIDGHKLTKWFFKLLVGVYHSQNKSDYIGDEYRNASLVKLLFSDKKLPMQFGFSVSDPPTEIPEIIIGDKRVPPWCFQFFEADNRVGGLEFWSYPFAHRMHLTGPDYDASHRFRPKNVGVTVDKIATLDINYLW